MLDTDTKRRIDTARDILVGKVPDPKSQVEQITIALIYKFMDDMDAEAEALGGARKFFAGDFARYGWPKLMRSGLYVVFLETLGAIVDLNCSARPDAGRERQ
jgi:type I restriction enzyme M protein